MANDEGMKVHQSRRSGDNAQSLVTGKNLHSGPREQLPSHSPFATPKQPAPQQPAPQQPAPQQPAPAQDAGITLGQQNPGQVAGAPAQAPVQAPAQQITQEQTDIIRIMAHAIVQNENLLPQEKRSLLITYWENTGYIDELIENTITALESDILQSMKEDISGILMSIESNPMEENPDECKRQCDVLIETLGEIGTFIFGAPSIEIVNKQQEMEHVIQMALEKSPSHGLSSRIMEKLFQFNTNMISAGYFDVYTHLLEEEKAEKEQSDNEMLELAKKYNLSTKELMQKMMEATKAGKTLDQYLSEQ